VSQSEFGDALVLGGLALQGGAILVILVRAGAFSEAWSATRRLAGAARDRVTRLLDKLPWREGPTYLELASNDTTVELSPNYGQSRPFRDLEVAPASMEEVRDELNVLRQRLNWHDDRVTDLARKSSKEVGEAKADAEGRIEEIESTRKAEVNRAIRERRWEGFALLLGFLLQIVGVALAFGGDPPSS
jgi:hypothetical protein